MAESSVTFFPGEVEQLGYTRSFSIGEVEGQIREVAHDAEDVIDEFIFNMDHQRQKRLKNLKFLKRLPTCVGFATSYFHPRTRQSGEGDQCHDREDHGHRSKYGLEALVTPSSTSTDHGVSQQERRTPTVEETDVVEIKDGMEVVKQMLIKEDPMRREQWRPLIQARELLLSIISSVMSLSNEEKKEMREMGEDELGGKLRECLKTRTNGHEVVGHTDSQALVYELPIMDDDESWELFLKKTFGARDNTHVSLSKTLEELGRKIVAKCKGLPLAIVVLGGLLSTKEKTEPSWERVLAKDSEIKASKLIHLWIAEGFVQRRGKEKLEDIAEDYLYELIHRSMVQVARKKANGRVMSCRIHDLLRDLAISEARDAKLFEVHENIDFTFPNSIRRLSIHQHLIKNNISQHLHNSLLRSVIFFTDPIERKDWRSIREHVKLLSVLDLGRIQENYILPKEIGELIHLKFLCIKGVDRVTLPSSIKRLVNLQNLNLGYNDSYIPCTIWKLQELRHLNCRYGEISSQFKLNKCMINGYLGVEQLTNLQTLALRAGSWLEGGSLGKLTQLRQLDLRGWLTPYLKKGFFDSIAELTTLRTLSLRDLKAYKKKTLLNQVGLKWQENVVEEKTLMPGLMSFSRHTFLYEVLLHGKLDKLPEQTEFYPPNLLKLTLSQCELEDDPMLILAKLRTLRILRLIGAHMLERKWFVPVEDFFNSKA
ncbi:putative disease resistance RPP13-like protein 3 [Vitis vinifera]|uniref:Putative disease resistance RPP13-like protein 3 n=1 Tax=Vitis vinifera TaxID=29760 RepID=A0A438JM45_VITVI|nr:putative disease resistance RPP13-like protein 3 [Vitis vinifera]